MKWDRQLPDDKVAWIVERNLNFKPILEQGFNSMTTQDAVPWLTQDGSMFKHVGIRFYNGSIYSYSDDSRVLESKERGKKIHHSIM